MPAAVASSIFFTSFTSDKAKENKADRALSSRRLSLDYLKTHFTDDYSDFVFSGNSAPVPVSYWYKQSRKETNLAVFNGIVDFFENKYNINDCLFITLTVPALVLANPVYNFESDKYMMKHHRKITKILRDKKNNFDFAFAKEFTKKGVIHWHLVYFSKSAAVKTAIVRYYEKNYKFRAEIRLSDFIKKDYVKILSDKKYVYMLKKDIEKYKSGVGVRLSIFSDQDKAAGSVIGYLGKYLSKDSVKGSEAEDALKQYCKSINKRYKRFDHSQLPVDIKGYRDHYFSFQAVRASFFDYQQGKIDYAYEKADLSLYITFNGSEYIIKKRPPSKRSLENSEYLKNTDFKLSEKKVNLKIYSGPAGYGKTYELLRDYNDFKKSGGSAWLVSYTGKNSIRIGGSTIHAALGILPILDGDVCYYQKDRDRLPEKIYVDELSLLSTSLFQDLIRFCQINNVKLISSADFNQISKLDLNDFKKYLEIEKVELTTRRREKPDVLNAIGWSIDELEKKHKEGYKIITADYELKNKLNTIIETDEYVLNRNLKVFAYGGGELLKVYNGDEFVFVRVAGSENIFYSKRLKKDFYFSDYDLKTNLISKNVACSVLKSQGSEFEKVVYLRSASDDEKTRYTAMTRATKTLFICDIENLQSSQQPQIAEVRQTA